MFLPISTSRPNAEETPLELCLILTRSRALALLPFFQRGSNNSLPRRYHLEGLRISIDSSGVVLSLHNGVFCSSECGQASQECNEKNSGWHAGIEYSGKRTKRKVVCGAGKGHVGRLNTIVGQWNWWSTRSSRCGYCYPAAGQIGIMQVVVIAHIDWIGCALIDGVV